MNTLSMNKKPREVGFATKKKCLHFSSLLFQWIPSNRKEMVIDFKSISPPIKIYLANHIPSFG